MVVLESLHGAITIGGKIVSSSYFCTTFTTSQDGQSNVTLKAYNGINIEGKIDGQTKVKLRSRLGQIFINGKIDGGSRTEVYYWGAKRVDVVGGVQGNILFGHVVFQEKDWETEDAAEAERRKMELLNQTSTDAESV